MPGVALRGGVACEHGGPIDEAQAIAPWIAGVHGPLAPRLVLDRADSAFAELRNQEPTGAGQIVGRQVDVVGVGADPSIIAVREGVVAREDDALAVEVVPAARDAGAWGSEHARVERRGGVDVPDRHDDPEEPHDSPASGWGTGARPQRSGYLTPMLRIDYSNCLSTRVGDHGIEPDLLVPGAELHAAAAALARKLASTKGTGWERWRLLHEQPMRSAHVEAVTRVVGACRGRFDNMVVLGIGGSALGNLALQSALNPATHNLLPGTGRAGPRMFVVDNVDPSYLGSVLRFCEASDSGGLKRTLFNVISKSGETAETAAQFMVVRDMLRRALGPDYKSNIVAITDPAKGTMRQICDAEGFTTLPVPDGVGGRFSVLSPVGLFSAAMCGIDINGLLDGAAAMDGCCSRADLHQNPAALLATILVTLGARKGKSNHVMMPYANALYLLADWYRQLWAESLGKKFDTGGNTVYAGFTPIKALGTTDQHSQVQLYREGPNDKAFALIEVESFASDNAGVHGDVSIPTGLGVEAISYLEGKSMTALLNAEKRATEYALVESQRPNFTITFPRIDAHHVGQFIYLWEMVTAYAGLMLGIDAYDQPAVETGKVATFGLMGRAGYQKHRDAVDRVLTATSHVWKG